MVKEVQGGRQSGGGSGDGLECQVHGVEEGLKTEVEQGASRAEDHQGRAGGAKDPTVKQKTTRVEQETPTLE